MHAVVVYDARLLCITNHYITNFSLNFLIWFNNNCIIIVFFGTAYVASAVIETFPSHTNITEGEGVYFKIKTSGVPQPTVTWYHDGEPVKGDYAREIEEDGSLAIPSTELKHSGVYKAVVTNEHGSEEREVKLTVTEEGGNSITTAFDEMISSRPIAVPDFGKYVAELHANSNQPFKDLYQVCVDLLSTLCLFN